MQKKVTAEDDEPTPIEFKIFNFGSKVLYIIAAFVLLLLALAMVGMAIWTVLSQIIAGESFLTQLLDSIGLIIIAVAVFDVAKFFLEEQVLRERKLQHIAEARRSLTVFLTTIIIAVSLEALVIVFQNKEDVYMLFYPSALLAVAVFAVIGLGLFQWLTRDAEETTQSSQDDDD